MSSSDEDDSLSADSEFEDWKDKRSHSQKIIECVCLNLTQIAWSADNALLPAVFKEFSKEFHVDTTALSILVLLRGVSESIFSFPSGFLADVLPRPRLIMIGSIIWAVGLVGCAMAPSFYFVCISRLINGVGLGIVQPLLCSLIADTNPESRRGSAFGTLQFTGNMGATFGGMFATSLAPLVVFGISGWRMLLYIVAVFSGCVGVAVYLLVGEPRAKMQKQSANKSVLKVFTDNLPKVWSLFRIKSFVIVLAQGAPGTIPWFAFSFLTMYLELSCFSNSSAARIYMSFGFGNAAAGLLGGWLLDFVSRRFPNHGPPFLAQLSSGIGIPMLGVIFFMMPSGEGAGPMVEYLYCSVFFFFGMLVACCGIINSKIFADIVPQAIFTYVYAVDRTIEGTIGAAGSPAVGLLTDKVFHYNATAAQAGECSPSDAHSLGMGVYTISVVAWSICFFCYCLMHCTYPSDRRRMLQVVVPGKGPGSVPIMACGAYEPSDDSSDSEGETTAALS